MSGPQRLRLQLTPKVKQKNQLRQRLVVGSSVLAVALLFGLGVFMYGNIGTSQEALASTSNNMGFEDGTSDWTSTAGSWSSDNTVSRSGSKSLKNAATTSAARNYNNNAEAIIPSSGTNYVTVIVWAKASNANGRAKLGIYCATTSTETTQASYTTLNSTSWTQIAYTISVSNSKIYYPVLYGMESSGTGNVYLDDVSIYYSTSSTSDLTDPISPNNFSVSVTGSSPTFNWTSGTDATSGVAGTLILRISNILESDVPVNEQTTYSTSSTVGPTTIVSGGNTWSVVYNGTNTTTFTEPSTLATGGYTYLFYTRDKAGNFTTASSGSGAGRMYVFIGGTTTKTLSASASIDGLYIPSGNTLQITSAGNLTIRSGASIAINGTLEQIGQITNNGTITVGSTGTYNYNRNGGAGAGVPIPSCTWASGSTCLISGITANVPSNIGQSFSNFTWNCTSQTASLQLSGALTTINGNFTMTSTGTGDVKLSSSGSTLTVGGNYSQTGGTLIGSSGNNASPVLDIAGNFSLSGGTLEQLGNAGAGSYFGVNVGGNFSHTGGTLTSNGNPHTRIEFFFDKTGTQTFTASGNTVSGQINYTVNSGSILNLGTATVNGTDFTVSTGGEVIFGSTAGISSSGATGNIQVSGTRSLSTSGNYTFSGSSAQVTGAGLPATVNNLTINNAAGVTLSQTVAVAGTLTLTSGKITTGSYEVNVTNASTSAISGYSASSYIYGSLRRKVNASGSYDFPIGTTSNYQYINILLVVQVGISNLLATFTSTAPTAPSGIVVNGVAVTGMLNSGYWTVTPNSTMLSGTYTATTQAKGYSTTGLNSNTKFYLLKRHDATSNWQALGTQIPVLGQTIGSALQAASSLLTSWSDFGEGYGGGSTLPITLSAFTVNLVDNKYADLNWVTSAELNNAYFDVERSADGKNYEAIARVDGHGTSLVMNEYSFKDEAPLDGISYYRLKQVDFDGPFTYSPIESLNNAQVVLTADDVNVFPNPATTEINVAVQMKKEGDQQIEIIDLAGRVVYSQSQSFYEGQNQFKLPLDNLPTGFYFVKFGAEGETPVLKKFLKN